MYLKRIITVGFKSFANEINIELSKGTTGVVGPNGSGKSNVVDAVRWVLGEQSVKSLRGDSSMGDIIFSGSTTKKASNYASVTLIFDNTDKFLPIEYSEVSIKRLLYKNLENEYYINNNRCRLKDITDLLIDSGVNKESFNIISQGEVSDIISSKATDRRIIFDSASGVLKYKKRKEEAIRKLERTHENLERVTDIITELELQVEPLKGAKEKAQKYLSITNELKKLDVSLISNDITVINNDLSLDKDRIKVIEEELLNIETNNNVDDSLIIDLKNKLSKIDDDIFIKNKKLNEISGKVEKLNGEKNLLLEKKKNNVDNDDNFKKVNELKENILKLNNDINNISNIIKINNDNINSIKEKSETNNKNIVKLKNEKNVLETDILSKNKKILEIKNNIEILEANIENLSSINIAAKSIISNPKLTGIHNTLGSLISVDNMYITAINVALASSIDFVICDNKNSAKEAIEYLKKNNLGRATFFPIDTIIKKDIDNNIVNKLSSVSGFISMAIDLVKYDKMYDNIMCNILSNVVVAKDLDSANKISELLNKTKKVVTIDGEVVHIGGSITGGNIKNKNNILTDRYKLIEYKKSISNLEEEINNILKKEEEIVIEIKKYEEANYQLLKETVEINEVNSNKELTLKKFINDKDSLGVELNSFKETEDDTYLKEYYEAIKEKEELDLLLNNLIKEKKSLFSVLEEKEMLSKKNSVLFNNINKELNSLKLKINKNELLLDNLLNNLNEDYSLTYEKAIKEYYLDVDINLARTKVLEYKNTVKSLGMVNIDAIEEYDRINTRFEFLKTQKEDLYGAESNLISIINELDSVMKDKFLENFKLIEKEFSKVFMELFGGGEAKLCLTEPNNLLETGIDIIASPPGKTLTSISLLSGGEKTLTAISLLFAIIKTKEVPFCLLDEVEAALDEVNVDKFGKYLNYLKTKTQFIVITHKKKTMEYVDYLYGITMDKTGISKLVSVKLEEIK